MMKQLDNMSEPELRDLMNNVAHAVNALLPKGTGFIVLAAPFNKSGIAQYVSNGTRSDCIMWLRETADRLESNEENPR
jgi:hypothetical protein